MGLFLATVVQPQSMASCMQLALDLYKFSLYVYFFFSLIKFLTCSQKKKKNRHPLYTLRVPTYYKKEKKNIGFEGRKEFTKGFLSSFTISHIMVWSASYILHSIYFRLKLLVKNKIYKNSSLFSIFFKKKKKT